MCLRFKEITKIWPWTINLQQSTKYQNYKPGLVLSTKRKCTQFSNGDKTYVEKNGSNLSGGQQQRISLARCAYRKAEIYLLDDPLSSLDIKVRNNIFHSLISNEFGLLKDSVVFSHLKIYS